jgi:hypothetical protein
MPASLTTQQVWREVERASFAVLGMVSARGHARSAGIVYMVRDRHLFFGSDRSAWKVRHIQGNPNVSLTVTIPKRLPLLPWIKIPAATITFQGTAHVHALDAVPAEIPQTLFHGLEMTSEQVAEACIIEVEPAGRFLTYGIGVSLAKMRVPEDATGTAPV